MEDLKEVIETVRNALFIDEESDAFERVVDRLEGYEIAYNTLLKSNEQLEKQKEEYRLEVCRLYDKYCR